MSLVTTEKLLLDAQRDGYAVGAFNAENMEMVMAIITAAEKMQSPVIIQTTPSTVEYGKLANFVGLVTAATKNSTVPVALHLDHGNSFELCMKALRLGYTSIMIDGSHGTFEENVRLTKAVYDSCAPTKVSVEAELGKVGGKEDNLDGGNDQPYTNPLEAKEFVERTKIDSLAIAIGTAHGVYKGVPKLDLNTLNEIRKVIDIPLVLHGTSGVDDDVVRECIKRGICKVNYATDLRIAFTKGVKEVLSAHPETIDPKKYNQRGMDYVETYVMDKIKVCGSENRVKHS